MIDCFFSQPHYYDHLAPIMAALPDDRRGYAYAPSNVGRPMRAQGIDVRTGPVPRSDDPLLVAGRQDIQGRRPVVFVEHGAGQTYEGFRHHPGYAGGEGRDRVGLFICPRGEIAEKNLARYPDAKAAVVGCPKLDRWQTIPKPGNAWPVVAITFHWRCHLVPEAGSAFDHFRAALAPLAEQFTVLGHAHPRARRDVEHAYNTLGIEIVRDSEELVRRADVLVADNTSLMYEWAALDRPVVAMNAPGWRRDVDHGLRFWSHVPGPQCSNSDALVATVHFATRPAMHGQPPHQMDRWAVQDYVYGGLVDGHASERAATAVLDFAMAGT